MPHGVWLLALALVALTFIAYQPVWRAGFIWDDNDHLTANPAMIAPHGLRMIWSSLAVSRYYPLTLTSFWVQRQLWGLNPMPYHLVNVALHAINGMLVFFLLRRLRVPAAWLAAMLWVLHPVNVESVAWITELKNTQSGFFFFLSLLCFLLPDADKKPGWYALAIVFGLAAMLSKPSTVVLPLVLLLCVWWKRGHWNRTDFVRTAPFFGLAAGMSALTIIEQRGHVLRAGATDWQLGPAERLIVAGKAIWFYAAKVLWPVRLTFVYPRWAVDSWSLWSWVPTVALVAVAVTLWRCRSRAWCRAVLFGGGFFVAALLPVLGFFDIFYFRYSFVADHFQYLACVGLIALAASTGTAICERGGRWARDLGMLAAAIVLLILGVSTWRQARIYENLETLWLDTLTKNPRCWLAHNNLGNVLLQQGKISDALGHYEQALRLEPDRAETQINLGNVSFQQGRVNDALGYYEQALRLKPDYAEAHNNLGIALAQMGKTADAIAHYEQALRIKPDYADAHNSLGIALARTGKIEDAIAHYEQALRFNPDYAEAHCNLGNVFWQQGKVSEAVGHYEQALALKPDYAEAHNNLGIALARTGRIKEAITHYEQALRINSDYPEALNNLAWLLATRPPAESGNAARAVALAEQVCRLTGNQVATDLDTLAAAYAAAGRFDDAVTTAQKAVALARSGDQPGLAGKIESRLQLYRNGHAYRQPADATKLPPVN